MATKHRKLARSVSLLAVGVGLSLSLTACWNSGNHPEVKLSAQQVVGTWTSASIHGLTPTLSFSSGGTFVASNIPEWMACDDTGAKIPTNPIAATGTWEAPSREDGDVAGFDVVWEGIPDGNCESRINTETLDGVVKLFQWKSDPDLDETISFIKVSNGTPTVAPTN